MSIDGGVQLRYSAARPEPPQVFRSDQEASCLCGDDLLLAPPRFPTYPPAASFLNSPHTSARGNRPAHPPAT